MRMFCKFCHTLAHLMFDFGTTNQSVKQRNYISGTRIAIMYIRPPGLKKCYGILLAGFGQVRKKETIICTLRCKTDSVLAVRTIADNNLVMNSATFNIENM